MYFITFNCIATSYVHNFSCIYFSTRILKSNSNGYRGNSTRPLPAVPNTIRILAYIRDLIDNPGDQRQWPNSNLGPLNPKDRHFPLPGQVGMPPPLDSTTTKLDVQARSEHRRREFAVDELFNLDEEHDRLVKMQTYITNAEDVSNAPPPPPYSNALHPIVTLPL